MTGSKEVLSRSIVGAAEVSNPYFQCSSMAMVFVAFVTLVTVVDVMCLDFVFSVSLCWASC